MRELCGRLSALQILANLATARSQSLLGFNVAVMYSSGLPPLVIEEAPHWFGQTTRPAAVSAMNATSELRMSELRTLRACPVKLERRQRDLHQEGSARG